MSMSTLGRQLAAINHGAGGRDVGSTLPTSRRHEDAVGRGQAHSAQAGHGGAASSRGGQLHKPSIMYEDARRAADVPLATVRENCVASLRHLEATVDPQFGPFVGALCKANSGNTGGNAGGGGGKNADTAGERGLLTPSQNEKLDQKVEDLVYRLALHMNDNDGSAANGSSGSKTNNSNNGATNVSSSCLHVMEYLLRRYDLHLRPRTASTALLALLPHHEEPYFLRLLQLIDLANLPEWAFLRPYAVPGARVGREVLARQASKDTALVRALARLSQHNAKLLVRMHQPQTPSHPRPQQQQSLSFTAAVLVEALTLQTRRGGGMDERTCQALLPFVVTACRNKTGGGAATTGASRPVDELWQNWGHVMASTMVEASVCLAPEPRTLLVTSILQGLQARGGNGLVDDFTGGGVLWNGLIVAMTILAQEPPSCGHGNVDSQNDESRLLLVGSPSTGSFPSAARREAYCGYSMDKQILTALLKLDEASKDGNDRSGSRSQIAACFGYLYSNEGIVETKQWVASVLVVGWKRLVKLSSDNKGHGGDQKKSIKRCQRLFQLILTLVEEASLQGLWKDGQGQWVESYTSFLLLHTPRCGRSSQGVDDDGDATMASTDDHKDLETKISLSPGRVLEAYAKSVLKCLRCLHKTAYERGLTDALIQHKNKDERMALAKWLGLAKLPEEGEDARMDGEIPTSNSLSLSLPPRVALEHADFESRLRAIPTLVEEAKEEDVHDRISVDGADDGETILQALMRRFLHDDNEQVALAAAKGLTGLMDCLENFSFNIDELAEGALEAIFIWATRPGIEEDVKAGLLCNAFCLASHAAKRLRKSDADGNLLVRLLEALGAFMSHENESVSLDAAKALVLVTQAKINSKSPLAIHKQAQMELVSDESFLKKYRRPLKTQETSDLFFRRRFLCVLLNALVAKVSSRKISKKAPLVLSEAIDYVVWVVGFFGDGLSESETTSVEKCLGLTAEFLASVPERIPFVFHILASCNETIFNKAAAPYIRTVCENLKDKLSAKVAPMAVIMEIIVSSNSTLQVRNLLSLAKHMAATDKNGNSYAVAPAMTLACRPDKESRDLALEFLLLLQNSIQDGERKCIFEVCQHFKENRSSTLFGCTSFLSGALISVLSNSKQPSLIQKNLLEAAVYASSACASLEPMLLKNIIDHRWLDACEVSGGHITCLTILEAAESTGENIFPLSQRWALAGKSLLETFLIQDCVPSEDTSELQRKLMFAIMRMLTGAKVVDPSVHQGLSSTTIISTGPLGRGGRARSYSFGKGEGISYLKPYPKDMQDAIVSVLESTGAGMAHKMLRGCLFETVLSSESWKREIFAFLDGTTRRRIASAILGNAVESKVENADLTFFSLPLDSSDVAELFAIQGRSDDDLSRLTFVSDFVNSNAVKLLSDPTVDALFAIIFKQVSSLSKETDDTESIEYARQALLLSLLALANALAEDEVNKVQLDKGRKFESWMVLLVDILGGSNKTKPTAPLSLQNKRTIFNIVTVLCKQFPKAVAPNLLPMINGLMSDTISRGESSTLAECFKLVLPVYFSNLEVAELSVPRLFCSFLEAANKHDSHLRPQLYEAFVGALATIDSDKCHIKSSPVGTFVAAMLAFDTNLALKNNKHKPKMAEVLELASQMWSEIPETARIEAVWTILSIAREIIFDVIGEESMNHSKSLFDAHDLCLILTESPTRSFKAATQKKGDSKMEPLSSIKGIKEVGILLMVVICDVLATPESRKTVRYSEGAFQTLILRLWQDLLLVQSCCHNHLGASPPQETDIFVERIGEVTGQTLDAIQSSLPSHMFLAFVSNLMKEGETEELRAKAVQLIADRSVSIQSIGPEIALFVDMIPALLALLEKDSNSETRTDGDKVLEQSVFAAIDSIGRSGSIFTDNDADSAHVGIFADVVAQLAQVIGLEKHSASEESGFLGVTAASRQLVSSAAVCASTSVRVCGLRALPALPMLMKSLLGFLSDATTFLTESVRADNVHIPEQSQAKLMQLAILRTFNSILENLSKFLQPYVGNMLRELSRIRDSLSDDSDNQSLSVRAELERVEALLTKNIPSRQLIPAAMKSTGTITDSKALLTVLQITTESVKRAKSSELSGQTQVILKIATYIFEQSTDAEVQSDLLSSANELLLSLVLKLSEIQLRSLYSKIREWRGGVDSSDPDASASRRLAFWLLSSSLSKHLRSIFLPCLTMVFPDMVEELVSIRRTMFCMRRCHC